MRCVSGRSVSGLDAGGAARRLRRLCARAGIAHPINPHSLRRNFCTTRPVAGVAIRDIQVAIRHSGPRTTMRYDMAQPNLDRHGRARRCLPGRDGLRLTHRHLRPVRALAIGSLRPYLERGATRRGRGPRSHGRLALSAPAEAGKSPGQHSVSAPTDNCYRSYAQTNAQQLADLLDAS